MLGGGGRPGEGQGSPPPSAPSAPTSPDDPNLEYTRQQTDLALRTLREEAAKEKSPLLEHLGWTQAEAEKFLGEWQTMMKAAQEQGPRSQEAKKADQALRSLGLRPRNTQSTGRGPSDAVQVQRAGRVDPPPEWRELFDAYSKSLGSDKP